MIRVRVTRLNNHIQSITVKGHAGSAEYGHDLVCAIVSGIVVGLCNALNQLTGEDNMTVREGHVSIQIEHPDDKTDLILETGLIQLKTAEEVNQDYLKITEV
ncbi:MAG: ribosomal-processing cysteine protease Prp [Bulleidia sp.]